MTIDIGIRTGIGRGPTALAAFDGALREAGVANFNLIRLSSVIPPGARVHCGAGPLGTGEWGDGLFAVWAFEAAERLGQEAWAGVAWAQDADGRGMFVEHEGGSEAQVRNELDASLASMLDARGLGHLQRHALVAGIRCDGEPVGALVIAPYSIRPWTDA